MDSFHLFTADETAIAKATFAGSFLAVLVRRPPWLEIVSWVLVGQVTSYYWVAAICLWWMLGPDYFGVTAFCMGAFGHVAWSAAFQLFEAVKADPVGTIDRLWRTIRGQSGGSER